MTPDGRRFWRPSGDGVRHAFRGRRYNGQSGDVSVCGVDCALAEETSETEWVMASTCAACNTVLRAELAARRAARDADTGQG